jgi:hypothetical protein
MPDPETVRPPGAGDRETLFREGIEALRRGQIADAKAHFGALEALGPDGELAGLLRAASHRAEGDDVAEETALNRLIDAEPRSVRGHIMKADCRARAGNDDDLACFHYRTALRLAEGRQLLPGEAAEVGRAARTLAELQERIYAARASRLAERGLPPATWSPRLQHSLDLAAGRRRPYRQQPTTFDYVGLPHVQFHDPGQFGWVPAVEAAAPAMRAELVDLLATGGDAFHPYIRSDVRSIPLDGNRALLDSADWSVLALCEHGWVIPEIVERCPRIWTTLLQHVPLPRIPGWGPTVTFSMLKAGARIAPHTGTHNSRLICHLPLIVPPDCRFRVGNETRAWEEGKLLIFDDTIEHEAWNDGAEDRVVLIFDIWRPELTEQERYELTLLFSD